MKSDHRMGPVASMKISASCSPDSHYHEKIRYPFSNLKKAKVSTQNYAGNWATWMA
jgi:hypothetical protein